MSEKGAAQRNGPAPHSDILAPFGKNVSFGGVKLKKSLPKNFCGSMIPIKCTFCKKNWTKTVNPALSSGLNFFPPPIWGHHHQLDDHQRNPNMNNRDHLVGQLTTATPPFFFTEKCNEGGLELPLSTLGGDFTTQNLRKHKSGNRCAVLKIVHP